MNISERIINRMGEIGLSQKEFSRLSGIPESTVSDWKKKGNTPKTEKLLDICDILGISIYDLLCEDESNDLWIIELKKDSGYDDPFEQTKTYIDWFEKNKAKKGQKVYGIICLNNPSRQLIKKVSSDPRIRLFEYNITYTEIN